MQQYRRYNRWSTLIGTLLFAWGLLRLVFGDPIGGVLLILVGSAIGLWTVALRIEGTPAPLYGEKRPRGEAEVWQPRVVHFYTRKNCSLCHEARVRLETDLEGRAITIVDHDVDTDVVLQRRYGDRVPVAVFEGGEVFALSYDRDAVRAL